MRRPSASSWGCLRSNPCAPRGKYRLDLEYKDICRALGTSSVSGALCNKAIHPAHLMPPCHRVQPLRWWLQGRVVEVTAGWQKELVQPLFGAGSRCIMRRCTCRCMRACALGEMDNYQSAMMPCGSLVMQVSRNKHGKSRWVSRLHVEDIGVM